LTQIKVKEQRFSAALHLVGSSIMRITHALKWAWNGPKPAMFITSISVIKHWCVWCQYCECVCQGTSWSYGSWIYNYLCNQCLSPLKLEPRSWRGVLDTTLCDKVFSDLRQIGGFLRVLRFPSPIKLTAAI
jgi:hypothetical protein